MSFRLTDAIFWVAVACCAIGQLAIIRSVVKSSTAPTAGDSATPLFTSSRIAEIVWAIVPGFALAALLFYTWRAMR